jgi:hypothetical protein
VFLVNGQDDVDLPVALTAARELVSALEVLSGQSSREDVALGHRSAVSLSVVERRGLLLDARRAARLSECALRGRRSEVSRQRRVVEH